MTTIHEEQKNCTVFLLGKAYQKAHGGFKKLLEPYGLTNIQHLVVEAVVHEPGQTAGELGKILILDKATLSGVIQRLNESSWIVKRSDDEDARVQRLHPTAKSITISEAIAKARDQFDTEFLARFSLEERILLKRLLRDLVW